MTTMAKRRILVIGSKNHNRANCIDWLQPFPNIEEYDSIIINLQSLTQEVYDKTHKTIRGMKESIMTVFNTDREIFCIMNKLIHQSPPATGFKGRRFVPIDSLSVSLSNYDWLPIRIEISERKKGTSIDVSDHRFDRYFQCVDEWKLEISQSFGHNIPDMLNYLAYELVPIAENRSEKMIGGTFVCKRSLKIEKKGAIHLLPPPTKCGTHEVIEIILDLICGEERRTVPPWRKGIEVPKVEEIQRKIQQKTQKQIQIFTAMQEEISGLQIQMFQWDSYRDLLTATGDDLENIVQKALFGIGIKTKKTEKGFPADLISNKVAIEITGIKGCVGVGSEKVNQTGRFKQNYHKGEKIILIANTHMDLSPQKREGKIDFSPEVKKYFEALGVCCLTSKTLFELWKDVVTGKKDSKGVVKKILTKNGELMLSEFE